MAAGLPNIIYRGSHVLTMDDDRTEAEAVAVTDGWISAVDEVMALAGPETRIDDLHSLTLLSSFIDGHGHMASAGLRFGFADLQPPPAGLMRSIAQLQRALRDYRDENNGGFDGWILGTGYDESMLMEQRHPERHDLDAVSTAQSIFIWHISGHLAVANSKTLELAGIGPSTADPDGGVIRGLSGSTRPNGIVEERTTYLFQNHLPAFTLAHLLNFL